VFEVSPQVFVEWDLEFYLFSFVTTERYDLSPTGYVMPGAAFNPDSSIGSFGSVGEGGMSVQFTAGLGM
jgi:hypothetical protein